MFYEDFEVGQKYVTRTRYISGSEIQLIVGIMGATNPLFLSEEIAKNKGYEGMISPGVVISAYAFGLEYQTGIYDNIIGLVGVEERIKPTHASDAMALALTGLSRNGWLKW